MRRLLVLAGLVCTDVPSFAACLSLRGVLAASQVEFEADVVVVALCQVTSGLHLLNDLRLSGASWSGTSCCSALSFILSLAGALVVELPLEVLDLLLSLLELVLKTLDERVVGGGRGRRALGSS